MGCAENPEIVSILHTQNKNSDRKETKKTTRRSDSFVTNKPQPEHHGSKFNNNIKNGSATFSTYIYNKWNWTNKKYCWPKQISTKSTTKIMNGKSGWKRKSNRNAERYRNEKCWRQRRQQRIKNLSIFHVANVHNWFWQLIYWQNTKISSRFENKCEPNLFNCVHRPLARGDNF